MVGNNEGVELEGLSNTSDTKKKHLKLKMNTTNYFMFLLKIATSSSNLINI